ncbi:MAG TPA: gamma-glutamyltransferase [Gemmatimonadaceae bacterium]|nr:gamma-glutamyltransferase [Gemmatimonadaceae bacterium]
MLASSLIIIGLLQAGQSAAPAAPRDTLPAGARHPAFAPDGRLAVSIRGDIWIIPVVGAWQRVTSGGASDREPAWSADASHIVFSSDRSGKLDLWRVATSGSSQPEQLTRSSQPDGQPAVAPDGSIIFVRGRGAGAQLWRRSTAGAESRVTSNAFAERSPVVSPDGRRVAYIALDGTRRAVRLRAIDGDQDSVVFEDQRVDRLTWAGDEHHLALIPPRGDSVRVLDLRSKSVTAPGLRGEPAWSRDGRRMALAEFRPEDAVGYNGDPDRLGDRRLVDYFAPAGALRVGDAIASLSPVIAPMDDRAARNAAAFDQAWTRTAHLYYGAPDASGNRGRWESLAAKYRPRALGAESDDELRDVIHRMHAEHPPYRQAATGKAAVSSAHPVATEAGLTVLRAGGNVVDAAAAVSFALGVVEPDASGVAGYGQMLIHQKGWNEPRLIEFMSRVPEDAGIGNANAPATGRGGGAGPHTANVPGTVAAMYLAWQRHGSGKVAWADILAPAIRAARDGYEVSDGLATTLTVEREGFMQSPGSRALFYKEGRAARAGDTIRNPDLAWVLEQIAKHGADGFYKGEVAQKMVDDLRARGNAMKMSDMARYFAADRQPVSTTYRGYTIYSSAPPVDGGATLSARLNLLENFPRPKRYSEDAATTHAMIAAWQLVPSTQRRIADPAFWPVNTEPFVNKDTARIRWTCYDPDKALVMSSVRVGATGCVPVSGRGGAPSLAVSSAPPACEPHGYDAPEVGPCRAAGTTAFVVGDADGNIVSVTQTLGTWGGSFYVTPGLGFLYNDKLNSYAGGNAADGYGLRLAYARHGSTLAPTIAFEGTGSRKKPVMAVGAAGNAWITSAVYQTLVGMIDADLDPQAALEQPRFLAGGGGRGGQATQGVGVTMENGFAPSVIRRLEAMGYRPTFVSLPGELRMGYGAAVRISGGKITAGADPRRSGAAGAIR